MATVSVSNAPSTTGTPDPIPVKAYDVAGEKIQAVALNNSSSTEIGTAAAPIRTDPTGSTAQPVTGTFYQATQPISAATLPLPTNAAIETGGNLATIAGKDFATQTTLAALDAKVTAVNTGAVVVSSSALPTGAAIAANQAPPATGPTENNTSLAVINTEYSYALPASTKTLQFQCRQARDIRFAFTTGKVAGSVSPYQTLKAGNTYYQDFLSLTSKTIYFATSANAGDVVEVLTWQ